MLRHIAGLKIHAGSNTPPEPRTAGITRHAFPYLHYQLSATCKALLAANLGNQWYAKSGQRADTETESQDITLQRKLEDPTTHLCTDMTGFKISRNDFIVIKNQAYIPGPVSAFTYSVAGINSAGRQASAPPPFWWQPHALYDSTSSIDMYNNDVGKKSAINLCSKKAP